MRPSSIGRGDLLAWINEFVEASYSKVELCGDGVGYCQVLDALHPGIVPMNKVRLSMRSVQDKAHNVRLLNEVFQRLKFQKKVNIQKISKGVFQENLVFLQWLYGYTQQKGIPEYSGYARRLEFTEQMDSHLIPNEQYLREDQQERYQEQLAGYVAALEKDLRVRMESNYRMMGMLEKFTIQRNLQYSILRRIEKQLVDKTPIAKQLGSIIAQVPFDFHQIDS